MRVDNLMLFTRNSAALSADGQIGNAIDFRGRAATIVESTANKLYVNIVVKTAAATSNGTGTFGVRTGTTLTTDTIPVIAASGLVTLSTTHGYGITGLTKGVQIVIPVDRYTIKRYVSLWWDETAALTALRVAAYLSLEPWYHNAYADAVN